MKLKKMILVLLILIYVSTGMIVSQSNILMKKKASLSFAEEIIGKITVLDDSSEMVADLNKRDHKLLRISLKPGEYTVNLINKEIFMYCQVNLKAGELTVIMMSDFIEPPVDSGQNEEETEDEVKIVVKDIEINDQPEEYKSKCKTKRYRGNTLLRDSHVNFFIESAIKSIKIDGEREYFVGGNIGITLGDKVVLGFGGYGNLTLGLHPKDFMNEETILGYGGFLIGYNFNPKSVINTRISLLIGAGARGLVEEVDEEDWYWNKDDIYDECHDSWWDWDGLDILEGQIFFFIEPQLTFYVNLTRNLKFNFNISYRYTDDEIIDAKKLSLGFGLNITI